MSVDGLPVDSFGYFGQFDLDSNEPLSEERAKTAANASFANRPKEQAPNNQVFFGEMLDEIFSMEEKVYQHIREKTGGVDFPAYRESIKKEVERVRNLFQKVITLQTQLSSLENMKRASENKAKSLKLKQEDCLNESNKFRGWFFWKTEEQTSLEKKANEYEKEHLLELERVQEYTKAIQEQQDALFDLTCASLHGESVKDLIQKISLFSQAVLAGIESWEKKRVAMTTSETDRAAVKAISRSMKSFTLPL